MPQHLFGFDLYDVIEAVLADVPGRHAQGGKEVGRWISRFVGFEGKVQFNAVPQANRFQKAAPGREWDNFGGVGEILLPKHMSRRQSCMAAQIDLCFRREPAQVETVTR